MASGAACAVGRRPGSSELLAPAPVRKQLCRFFRGPIGFCVLLLVSQWSRVKDERRCHMFLTRLLNGHLEHRLSSSVWNTRGKFWPLASSPVCSSS